MGVKKQTPLSCEVILVVVTNDSICPNSPHSLLRIAIVGRWNNSVSSLSKALLHTCISLLDMPSLTNVVLNKQYAFKNKKTVNARSDLSSSLSFLDITPALSQYLQYPSFLSHAHLPSNLSSLNSYHTNTPQPFAANQTHQKQQFPTSPSQTHHSQYSHTHALFHSPSLTLARNHPPSTTLPFILSKIHSNTTATHSSTERNPLPHCMSTYPGITTNRQKVRHTLHHHPHIFFRFWM